MTLGARIWHEVRVAARETPAMYFGPVVALGDAFARLIHGAKTDDPGGQVSHQVDRSPNVRTSPKMAARYLTKRASRGKRVR